MFVVGALWWAATRSQGRVLLTAPGNKQVRNVLWKELRRILYSTGPDGRPVHEVLGVEPALLPSTGMQWPDGREIIGFSADVPENMQGFSGSEMLTIVDEGSGVEDPIFEVIDGNSAAGGHIATASQPTKQSGWFFDAFHSKREHWELLDISSDETPNVTGLEPAIPGLASADFIASRRAEYGSESVFYLVRVKGQFAGTASNAIVGLDAITAAHLAWDEFGEEPSAALELGVDVARYGDDDTVIVARRGLYVYELEAVHGFGTLEIVGKILEVANHRRLPNEQVLVKIDAGGGYGAGAADILRSEHSDCIDVLELNGAESSDDPERYANLRAQLHFGVAEWLAEGGALPHDRKLEAELLASTYSFDARARRLVEKKEDVKRRLKRSPDRADALALALYTSGASGGGISAGGRSYRFGAGRGF